MLVELKNIFPTIYFSWVLLLLVKTTNSYNIWRKLFLYVFFNCLQWYVAISDAWCWYFRWFLVTIFWNSNYFNCCCIKISWSRKVMLLNAWERASYQFLVSVMFLKYFGRRSNGVRNLDCACAMVVLRKQESGPTPAEISSCTSLDWYFVGCNGVKSKHNLSIYHKHQSIS